MFDQIRALPRQLRTPRVERHETSRELQFQIIGDKTKEVEQMYRKMDEEAYKLDQKVHDLL